VGKFFFFAMELASTLLPGFPARKTSNIGKAGEEEAKCEHGVHVLMTSSGYTTHDRRRMLLDKNTPLREVRRHLDRKLRQLRMTDDYGHAFQESDREHCRCGNSAMAARFRWSSCPPTWTT
jgi:hypothetical protein